jgi:hypothetical protein
VDVNGSTLTGHVLTVTPQTLTIAVDGTSHEFGEATVSRIERRRRFAMRGALLGAVGSVVLGMVAQTSCGGLCEQSWPGELVIVGIWAGLGAGTGAAVGAAFHRSEVVYRAALTRTSSVMLSPLFSRGTVGLRGSVAF